MEPFLSLRRRAHAPVLLTCEHATCRLPLRIAASPAERRVLATHWGWDIGAWELTREVSDRLGATAVGGRWSRLFIDLNRPVLDPTLIRHEAEGLPLGWNQGLRPTAIERRILELHVPYHVEVDRRIVGHLVRGVRPLIFSIHSFTPVLDGETRRFEVGVLYREHTRAARSLQRSLRERGLQVRANEPYSGLAGLMYSAERHGAHHGLPCLELEVNQRLFERPGAARRLGAVVSDALRGL